MEDFESTYVTDRIRADVRSGARSGVNGTPTLFVNGRRHDGPPETLIETVEAGL